MLFLELFGEPVGFAWLRATPITSARIEPVGIVPPCQGKGFGKLLLQAAIVRLVELGARDVRIGAWENNEIALHIYRDLGFKPHERTFYLAGSTCPS